MSTVCIYGSEINGKLCVPASKSLMHRVLVSTALAGVPFEVSDTSDDVAATGRLAQALAGEAVSTIDCGESATTLRLAVPLLAARGLTVTLTGHGRLVERPMGVYAEVLPPHGVSLRGGIGAVPVTVSGRLTGGRYAVPGDVSSQFISGLLMALPLCEGESEICLTAPLQSAPYVEMTLSVLCRAGIEVISLPNGWRVPGGQRYRPAVWPEEKDWSQAAVGLAAGVLAGQVTVPGVKEDSCQGDRAIVSLLRRFGGQVTVTAEGVTARRSVLHGCTVDVSQTPDLAPVLAVVGAVAEGETRLVGGRRLRWKESDRLASLSSSLRALGADVTETDDGLILRGKPRLSGGRVIGCRDHRVVMALAVAALRCQQPVTVEDAACVNKSWPTFWQDWQAMGGNGRVE